MGFLYIFFILVCGFIVANYHLPTRFRQGRSSNASGLPRAEKSKFARFGPRLLGSRAGTLALAGSALSATRRRRSMI